MFTGLIELLCPILSISELDSTTSGGGGHSITIGKANEILDDCHLGDSIAVNGACLTVTSFDESSFKVGVAPETLKRTNFIDLKVGDEVNCERAMKGDKRFGGHVVQGHVDTTATIRSIIPTSNALTITFRLTNSSPLPSSRSFLPLLISKGYVTIDGTSLTLIDVSPPNGGKLQIENENENKIESNEKEIENEEETEDEIVEFSVMLIKHTQDIIGLTKKKVGDKVNVEFDVMGKYAARKVENESSNANGNGNGEGLEEMIERIVRKVLNETK